VNKYSPQERAAAARELLLLDDAMGSMLKFREYIAPTYSKDFVHAPMHHHEVIITQLERLERGEISRLMILAPPASAKSTYCSVQYPLWRLAKRPDRNILCASNTQDLAEDFNRRRLNVALSPQWMILSDTKLKADLQKVGHFGVERGGEIRAAGIGSSITGWRSHLNVLDDPVTGVEQSMSPKTLDLQWDWFHREFRTRLEPGCPELIVSTRWAKNDICGRILRSDEADTWTVLRLPLLSDREDDPLGRERGEPMWPEFYTEKFIREIVRNRLLFETQYQQTPLDETGSWVDLKHLQIESPPNAGFMKHWKFVIAMDLALSIGKGDYTVFIVAALDYKRNIHIVHMDRMRVDALDSIIRLIELCKTYGPNEVLIDDDNASKLWKTLLHERWRREKFPIPPIHAMKLRGRDKEVRATAIRGAFHAGNVQIVEAPWNSDLIHECMDFPSSANDDIVDALSLIGRRLPMLSPPPRPPGIRDAEAEEAQQEQMIKMVDGKPCLNIPLDHLFEDRDALMRRRNNRV
jgi:predicted phage terminase large subunit-like protein